METPKKEIEIIEKANPAEMKTELVAIPRLRTYKEDVQGAVKRGGISSAKILMAEQSRRDKQAKIIDETSPKNPKNILYISITVIFILLAIGSVIFVTVGRNGGNGILSPRIINQSADLIDKDGYIELGITNKNRRDVYGEIRSVVARDLVEESVNEIILVRDVVDAETGRPTGDKEKIDKDIFFEFIESRAPTNFIRALEDNYMFGVYGKRDVNAATADNKPFILFRVGDFQRAYGSALEWESVMARDLQEIFIELKPKQVKVPIQTGTTTTESVKFETVEQRDYVINGFKDLVLANNDARALINNSGEQILFYSFVLQDQYLVIGQDTSSLREIVERLRESSLIVN